MGCFTFIGVFFVSIIFISLLFSPKSDGAVLFTFFASFAVAAAATSAHNESTKKAHKKQEDDTQKMRDSILNIINNNINFKSTDYFITKNATAFISIDELNKQILIGGCDPSSQNSKHKILSVKDILRVEITQDNKELASSNKGDILASAAIGGLLFGGSGAVVGAITGSESTAPKNVVLQLTVDDVLNPIIGINFSSGINVHNKNELAEAMSAAQKWYNIILIIIQRYKNDTKTNNKYSTQNIETGIIEKAKKLISEQDYLTAIILLNHAIIEKIELPIAYYLRAFAYNKTENKELAIADIKEAASLGNRQAIECIKKSNL